MASRRDANMDNKLSPNATMKMPHTTSIARNVKGVNYHLLWLLLHHIQHPLPHHQISSPYNLMSMSAFVRRIRRSFRPDARPSLPYAAINHPSQSYNDQHSAGYLDYDEEDVEHDQSHSSPLPVIVDRGPPATNRYANADIFWNSTMTEADDNDKDWLVTGRTRKARSKARSSRVQGITESKASKHWMSRLASENAEEEGSKSSAQEIAATRQRRQDSFKRLERNISYGRERADNDLTVMFYTMPDHAEIPANFSQRSSEPLSPGTRGWDNFMDFPINNSARTYSVAFEQPNVVLEDNMLAPVPLIAVQEEKTNTEIPLIYHKSSPSSSRTSLGSSVMMTWNICLNQILSNEAVDPAIKQAVIERVKNSTTTNGTGEGYNVHVSAHEAGLVPNFSYPVAGGEFYDRAAAIVSPPLPMTTEVQRNEDTERAQRTSPEHVQWQDFDFGFELSNGVLKPSPTPSPTPSPSPSPSPSSPSFNSSTDSLYRPTSPPTTDVVTNRINKLLSEVLSPSELNLCHSDLASTPKPPTPQRKTSSSLLSPLPTQTRLTQSLYSLLHHLQDHVVYFEDSLLPKFGEALETKTFTIDVLSIEIQNLDDQIHEMKKAVDFGNKILANCWLRDYEVWRTLAGIREKRSLRRRLWCGKLMGWKWSTDLDEGVLSPIRRGAQMAVKDLALKKGEINALMLMAEQNVQILREDMDDMVERIESCKRKFVAYPAVEREEGSWRDV
jgi:hypothetical protein